MVFIKTNFKIKISAIFKIIMPLENAIIQWGCAID